MFNFAEIIAAVVVTAINVVNTIVQTATGGQGNLAETFQSFTDTMNAAVGGGGDDRDNDQSDRIRPSGPSAEELRRLEQERQASTFDKDIDRLSGRDDVQDEGEAEIVPVTHRVDLRPDIASLFQGEPSSAVLQVTAAGNPIAQAVLQMLRNERSQLQTIYDQTPSPIACMISTFGLAAEDDE